MKSAAVNRHVQDFVGTILVGFQFFGVYTWECGIAGSKRDSTLNFQGTVKLFIATTLCHFAFPPSAYEGSDFPSSSPTLAISYFLRLKAILSGWEVVSH